MNFFKAQDKARQNTTRLVVLFALAIVSLVLLTNLLFIGTFAYMGTNENDSFIYAFTHAIDRDIIIVVSVGVSLLIIIGSIYKTLSLSKGGPAIAEMLGGQLVPQSTTDHQERKLLNVIEEMSIAAGMPIPKAYILNESSINAFAAGQSNSNAVIGVTRGALTQLTRDELQGVIAHEFSHILNGDMRLNLRLIGILHGILLIGIIGEHILRSFRYRSSGKKDNGGAIIFIGIGLLVIGYAGTFFGKWIKASVSRQREYLADASAVQFTRDKDTIAGALKKIGGLSEGSLLETPSASEYSHAYFSNGVSFFLDSMFSTHPPLTNRIKQIDPGWNGQFIAPKPIKESEPEVATKNHTTAAGIAVTAAILTSAEQAISQIGTLNETNIEYAQQLILSLPDNLRFASQSAYSARAVIYSLLIREQVDKENTWKLINEFADPAMPDETKKYYTDSMTLDETLILPLLELCVNALRELSENQYKQFKYTIEMIVKADKTIDLNEWVIQRLVLQQLDEHFSLRKPAKAKYAYLGAVKKDAEILLSLLAYIEHKDNEIHAKEAFELGKKEIGANAFNIIPKEELSLNTLNTAVDHLMELKPLLKPRILKACAKIILADGNATRKGVEIFRTISTNLDCPVPPLNIKT
ncbi:MAG: M48 family metallopeptidase [Gammaproteobacteria bacterium]|nr:M48 family metallopeptidase [Gammaproteobacteria bacterium]MCW8986858.1 M48 family metallopeptidase [Gammaproteobacteria bacterium]